MSNFGNCELWLNNQFDCDYEKRTSFRFYKTNEQLW